MSRNGTLQISLLNFNGDFIEGLVDVEMEHHRLRSERRRLKDLDATRVIEIDNLFETPQGIYKLSIRRNGDSLARRFVNIRSGGPTILDIIDNTARGNPVSVSPEDAEQMEAISREIDPFVAKMAQIVGRYLELPPEKLTGRFTLTRGFSGVIGTTVQFDNTESKIVDPSDDEIDVISVPPGACYDIEKQVCCPGDCPC